MLEIRTFGGLTLKVNSQSLKDLGSHKAEAILVYLAIRGGSCSRDVLATLLWAESAESQAMTSLRVALSMMRRNLEDYIEVSRDRVEMKPGGLVYFDVADLEAKLAGGDMRGALEIYQGDFLQGFNIRDCLEFEDWRRMQQERIHGHVTSALHAAISSSIEMEDYKKGQFYAQRLLELDPLDELAHREYMLLFALDHQRARAIEQYENCQAILQAELGVAPSEETQSLYAQISTGERPGSNTSLVPPIIFPAPQTSFIGRVQELTQITALLGDPSCRLLTMIGPGGIGKTRLALRAITKCYHSFSDGTYFIPLEGIDSADYLVHSIADGVHFKIDTLASPLDAKYQLLDFLKNRSILLVLDGFEHLVAGAGLLSEMIGYAAHIKLLVTSRQKLDLRGEWIFMVTGMPVPQDQWEKVPEDVSALQLFVERARQASAEFRLLDADRDYAIHICRLVEGMPLGIELAAAWAPILSPREITDEIQKNLDFLNSSKRDTDEKHHSLRATFDGSWMLLSQEQQDAFCKLSVFRGGFDRHAAMGVAGINLHLLSNLLDRSLLVWDRVGRFYMHSLLRQYADEKLKTSLPVWNEVHYRHCDYFTDFLCQREADLSGHKMFTSWEEVRREMENIRPAVDWAAVHWEGDKVRKILSVLLTFYAVQGWHEGKDAFRDIAQARKEALCSQNTGDWSNDQVYLSARTHQAFLQCNLGQIDESEAISRECLKPLQALGIREELSECIHNLGVNASFRGEYELAMESLEKAILLGKDSKNPVWPTYLLWLGHTYFLLGEYKRGMECLQKCYDLFDQRGNLWGSAFALSKMGMAADGLEEYEQARQYHREALTVFEKTGNQAGKGYALSRMSMSFYFLEEYPQAVQLANEGYHIFQPLGHQWGICTSLCRLGFGYIGLGDIVKAKGCFTDALELSRKYKMTPISLYALAGMAATLVQEGEEKTAVDLFRFVQSQTQIPAIYIQQTARWFSRHEKTLIGNGNIATRVDGELETLDDIIDRMLKVMGSHTLQAR